MSIASLLFGSSRGILETIAGSVMLGGVAAAISMGTSSPALAQSGELGDVILLDDIPGFADADGADTVIACRPDGTCVTGNGNVLAGFRPAVWPNLRVVDNAPVIESDVQVEATAFGRILARHGSILDGESEVETVADFCWTFDGGTPGDKICVSICEEDECPTPPTQCPATGTAQITLITGTDGDDICDDVAQQFFDKGVTSVVEQFQFVVGFDSPETAQPESVRLATCIVDDGEVAITYVPICRAAGAEVFDARVTNDIDLRAVETPRCVTYRGKSYC